MKSFKELVESLNEAWPKASDAKGFTGGSTDGKKSGNRHDIEVSGGVTKVTRKYDRKTGESEEPKEKASGGAAEKRGRGRPPGKYGSYKKKVKESIEIIDSLETEEEIVEFIESLDEESYNELYAFLESEEEDDAQDNLEEDVEQIDEIGMMYSPGLNHKSDATPGNGIEKGLGPLAKPKSTSPRKPSRYQLAKQAAKRQAEYAAKKEQNEEVEQIEEISKKTLGSYVKKATNSAASHAYIAGGGTGQDDKEQNKKDFATAVKRVKGIEKATDRLTKEETEQEVQPTNESLSVESIAALITKQSKE